MSDQAGELPEPGPGFIWRRLLETERINEGDMQLGEESQCWHETQAVGDFVGRGHYMRRVSVDDPYGRMTVVPDPKLPTSEQSRYAEVKRLAEIAWAAIFSVSGTLGEHIIAGWAWNAAEAMHAESEKRRPVQQSE